MTEINSIGAANALPSTTTVKGTSSSQAGNIQFPSATSDDHIRGEVVTKEVKQNLKGLKGKVELNEAFLGIFGTDHIILKGNGKMTYGQLREKLAIPPGILSKVNNARLSDNQVIKDEVRVNLEDIGWYETTPQSQIEADDIVYQRSIGNSVAGYNRKLSNEDIINILK